MECRSVEAWGRGRGRGMAAASRARSQPAVLTTLARCALSARAVAPWSRLQAVFIPVGTPVVGTPRLKA